MKMRCAGSIVVAALLGGCNAIYFYETDKVSLTLEARPDSTGPIQGSLGVKQRVVAFVPARDGPAAAADGSAPAANSDAMDVLSSMRVHKLPRPDGASWFKLGHTKIDAALITGDAARHVANPAAAIGALGGGAAPRAASTQVGMAAIVDVYEALRARPADARARAIADELDSLAELLPRAYGFTFYQPGRGNDVVVDTAADAEVGRADGFRAAATYWAMLEANVTFLERALDPRAAYTFQNAPATTSTELAAELARSRRLRDAFRQAAGRAAAVREAMVYFQKVF